MANASYRGVIILLFVVGGGVAVSFSRTACKTREAAATDARDPAKRAVPAPAAQKTSDRSGARPDGRATLREKVRFVDVTVEGDDEKSARETLSVLSASEIWRDALHEEQRRAAPRKEPPALRVSVARVRGGSRKEPGIPVSERWRVRTTVADENGYDVLVPGIGDETVEQPLRIAVAGAGLDLLFLRQPDRRRLEKDVLRWFEGAEGAERGMLSRRLARLGERGCFDALLAAWDRTPAVGRPASWKGKDYLAQFGRQLLDEEPIWTLYRLVSSDPLHIAIDSEVEITPVRSGAGVTVIRGDYEPGIATVHVAIAAAGVSRYDETAQTRTPAVIFGPHSPYPYTEQLGVYEHLLDAGISLVTALPKSEQRRYFPLLVEQLGRVDYKEKHHDVLEPIVAELARDSAECQDVLVNALGSQNLKRMDDRCASVFRAIGPACAPALARGLSHCQSPVRSLSALRLRVEGREWYGGERTKDIVARLIATLKDEAYRNAFPQALFLLREIGPDAREALPIIRKVARDRRFSGCRDAARQAERAVSGA
ncbi:MAG: hypothetical protein JXP34_17655 [Planctomycetes bacterium]|nr:hypothetical protein [Planctomycetota bacterium]